MSLKQSDFTNIKKILVIRTDALGDVVMSTPVFTALKRAFPQANVTALLRSYTEPLLKHHPDVDDILIDPIAEGTIRTRSDFWKYVQTIRQKQFDLMIALWDKPIYALLGWLAGIPIRIGDTSRFWTRLFYNRGISINWWDLTRHQVEHNLRLLKPLRIAETTPQVRLYTRHAPPPPEVASWLAAQEQQGRKRVAISLGTSGVNRPPTPAHFAELMNAVMKKIPSFFLLLGTDKEQTAAATLTRQFPNQTLDLTGKTSLSQMVSLLEPCALHIGGDSGPGHIAAALGVKTLTIFVNKNQKPSRWAPWTFEGISWKKQLLCPLICTSACRETICYDNLKTDEFSMLVEQLLTTESPYASLDAAKQAWLSQSLNVLLYTAQTITFQSQISTTQSQLRNAGVHVTVLIGQGGFQKTLKQLIAVLREHDINVIHHFGIRGSLMIRLAATIASNYICTMPLIVQHVVADPIKLYTNHFHQFRCRGKT